jgi:hypothetical protein
MTIILKDKQTIHGVMNDKNTGEIILYQPDSYLQLEVRLENEMVWLTQSQIAELFGTKRPAITKHLQNIFNAGELEESSVCSILEHTANDGKRWLILFLRCYGEMYPLVYVVNSVIMTYSSL